MSTQAQPFTHLTAQGEAHMVNVAHKKVLLRKARACGFITLQKETLALILDQKLPKGDLFGVARTAAIMASKKCSDLIPLCHPLALTYVSVDFEIQETGVMAFCEAHAREVTGVEMEALTGVSTALLTLYDMCKAVDKQMEIKDIKLLFKTKEEISL